MQIERVSTENLQPLEEFLAICGSSLESFRYFSTRPLSVIKNHRVTLLGFDGNRVPIAYGHLDEENETVWLGICVSEGNRGKGYGSFMMQALLDAAREMGITSMALTVDRSNLNAARLYEKVGFQLEKQSPKVSWYRLDLSEK